MIRLAEPDRPWIFRTYAGHTSVEASNQLFRENLARGQTGLSIAFDLPTQCGHSSDEEIAAPEVGKVGVPINSLDDMRALFDGIPLDRMNTSMTINATAMWLYALYLALAEEQGVPLHSLQGTTQNDIVKEYLSRGTYIFPPGPSVRLIADMYEHAVREVPRFNPANVCSYHLQEAGATPVQEVAYALSTATLVLDELRGRDTLTKAEFEQAVGRVSFFCNAGLRFVEELCKMRAFAELWDRTCLERYGVEDPTLRRFRYGVQVNSLGLTEEQPENNAWRIAIEMLGVLLSRDARCRALQLPAWNEALSLPRPWDQQWSLRLQQIMALETDVLDYPDLFEGSTVVRALQDELIAGVQQELARIEAFGGTLAALESGLMKSALVASQAARFGRIARGEQAVVGRNRYEEGLESPLVGGSDRGIFRMEADAGGTLARLARTKDERDGELAFAALARLRDDARNGANLVPASVACAKAAVTTGEWAGALRSVFGEYRPATGVDGQHLQLESAAVEALRARVEDLTRRRGRRPRMVVGKPGLDGHSNGAEMVAIAARHCGFDVVYSGIRLSAAEIARQAAEEDASVVGISILSGSHMEITRQLLETLAVEGAAEIPVVVGGIVPPDDAVALTAMGVGAVFTPRDYDLVGVMDRVVDLIDA
ncbi:MAG: ethylmalonyl-CoA mutase [Gaiellaceae bacterium]|nr:ethylmalonyl-CoA mutase [Gaiellaceae bacterium]